MDVTGPWTSTPHQIPKRPQGQHFSRRLSNTDIYIPIRRTECAEKHAVVFPIWFLWGFISIIFFISMINGPLFNFFASIFCSSTLFMSNLLVHVCIPGWEVKIHSPTHSHMICLLNNRSVSKFQTPFASSEAHGFTNLPWNRCGVFQIASNPDRIWFALFLTQKCCMYWHHHGVLC